MICTTRGLVFSLIGLYCFILSFLSITDIACASEESELQYTKGTLELQLGHHEKALEHFRKTVELDPNKAEAYYYTGVVLNRLAEYEEALLSFRQALALNPDLHLVHYDFGVAYFELGLYKEALEEFDLSYEHQPKLAILNHYLGLVLFKLGRYREALPYFLEARELDPKLVLPSHYYTGIMEYRRLNFDGAKAALQKAAEIGPETTIGRSSKEFLERIKKKEMEKRWNVYARAAVQYDDNVTIQPRDAEDYFPPTEIVDEKDLKWFFYGTGSYKPIWRPKWDAGFAFSVYNTTHRDLAKYDLLGAIPSAFINYRLMDFRFKALYELSYYQLGHDDYLKANLFSAEGSWIQAPKAFLRGSFRLSLNEYTDIPGRDSTAYDYRLGQYYYFKPNLYAKIGAIYLEERAEGDDFDYHAYGVDGRVSIPLFREVAIDFIAGYLFRDYENPSTIFTDASGRGIAREDKRMTFGAELVRRVTSFLEISLKWTYVYNESNISFYEYRRNVYGFNVILKF